MKKCILIICSVIISSKAFSNDAFQELSIRYTGGPYEQEEFRYRLMRPLNVEKGKRYPLILFLHGAGERGHDNELQLLYLPKQMAQPEFRRRYPCYFLAPQCRKQKQWVNVAWGDKESTPMAKEPTHQLKVAIKVLEQTRRDYPIDKRRVYLTGLSMGGYGTWELAARHPKLFAAAAPICGGGDERQAKQLVKLPIWAFHGDADKAVPVERSRNMVEAVRKAEGTVKYTEYPGVGHNSWTRTYQDPDGLLPWMFRQIRPE